MKATIDTNKKTITVVEYEVTKVEQNNDSEYTVTIKGQKVESLGTLEVKFDEPLKILEGQKVTLIQK
jgi:hypothetical protein